MPLVPGTRLGRYEIRSQLGAGGMGELYLAQDMKLDRTVVGSKPNLNLPGWEGQNGNERGGLSASPLSIANHFEPKNYQITEQHDAAEELRRLSAVENEEDDESA